MVVHWERYRWVGDICAKIIPPIINESDPPMIVSGCRKVVGTDCYVYTAEDRIDVVGGLVQDCFEQIQPKLKKPQS